MSGYDLLPVDGGDPIHLPPGETVLGRGPFLGVSDRRVSRHHGLLENLDGHLRLKPTHVNPCFIQSSLIDDPRPLQSGSWFSLQHGDFFSLLPSQLIYQVVALGEGDRTPRNSQMEEEEEEEKKKMKTKTDLDVMAPSDAGPEREQSSPSAPPPSEEVEKSNSRSHTQEGDMAPLKTEEKKTKKKDEDVEKEKEEEEENVAPPKSRVLPDWMMAVSGSTSSSSTLKVASAVKKRKPAATSTNTKPTPVPRARPSAVSSSPTQAELDEEEEEVRPKKKKRRRKSDDEDNSGTKADSPSDTAPVGSHSSVNVSNEPESTSGAAGRNGSMRTSASSDSQTDKKSDKSHPAKGAEPVSSNGSSTSTAALSKSRVRTACPYGKECYRKNPLHFQECSHPGDTDYEEEEEEEEDRPECPYGTDCYRKNPLHRKEYKHTKRPARSTRAVNKTSRDDDEEDEEYESSFINDDSEDGGDDSEYLPPADSDDSGQEDVGRLQKEARGFLQRTK